MDRNIVKMIDLTQFMLMESTGDSEAKSELDAGSFSRSNPGFFAKFDDDDDNNNDDDDAESCSYGSSHDVYENVHQHHDDDDDDDDDDNDDDGMSYNHDNGMDEDGDYDDAIDSKMVEVSKKCGAFTMGRRQDCSNKKFLIEKENDKNFWETCLAS